MASPGKNFRLFFPDPERRQDVWDVYVRLKSLYTMGESEVGFLRHFLGFQSLVVYYLGADNVLNKFGIEIPVGWWWVLVLPVLIVMKFFFYLSIGFFWDRKEMPHRFTEWNNQRNPMLKYIKEGIGNGNKQS